MNQEQLNNFANNFVVKPKEEQYEEMELEDLEVDRTEPTMPKATQQEQQNFTDRISSLEQQIFADGTGNEPSINNKPHFDNATDVLDKEEKATTSNTDTQKDSKHINWNAFQVGSSAEFDKANKQESGILDSGAQEQDKRSISNFLKRQSEQKLQTLLKTRYSFLPSSVSLNKCASTKIAQASGDGMYDHQQIENCFKEDLEKTKKKLKEIDEKYNKMLGYPALAFFAYFFIAAKAIHHAIETPHTSKAMHNYMDKKNLKELATFMNLSADEKKEYLKKMERDIQGYNDNIQSKDEFTKELNKDIEDNINEAAKATSGGKYDTAEQMIADGYFEQDLTGEEIKKLHQQTENLAKEGSIERVEQLKASQEQSLAELAEVNNRLSQADRALEDIVDNIEPPAHSKYFQQAYDEMLKEKKWTQDDINNLDLYERYSTMGKIYDEAAILAKQDGADSKNFIYKSSLNEMLRDMVKYRIDKTGEEELNLRSYIIDKLDKHDIKTDFNHIYSLSDQLNTVLKKNKTDLEDLQNLFSKSKTAYGIATSELEKNTAKKIAAQERSKILDAYGDEFTLKQKDKIAIEATDSIFDLVNYKQPLISKLLMGEYSLNQNIDKLEEFTKENFKNFSDEYNLIKANSIIMAKVIDQEKFGLSDQENIKFAKIVQDGLDKFHQNFIKTGEMNFKDLEAQITSKINEENIGIKNKDFKKNIGNYILDAIDDERIIRENDNPRYILKDAENIKNIHNSIEKINYYNENIRYAGAKNRKTLENDIKKHSDEKEDQEKLITKHIERQFSSLFKDAGLTNEEHNSIKNSVQNSLSRMSKSDKIKDAGSEILKDLAEKSDVSSRIKEHMIKAVAKINPVTGAAVYIGDKILSSAYKKYKEADEKLSSKVNILEKQNKEPDGIGVYRKIFETIIGGNGDKLDIIPKLAPLKQDFKSAAKEWFSILTNNVNYSDEINKEFKTDPARVSKILPIKLLFTKLNFADKISYGERPELMPLHNRSEMTHKTSVDKEKLDSVMEFLKKTAVGTSLIFTKGIFQKVAGLKESGKIGEEPKAFSSLASAIFTQKFDHIIGSKDPFRIASVLKGAGFSSEAISKMPINNLGYAKLFSSDALRVLDIQGKEYINIMQGMLKLKSISGIGDFMKKTAELKKVVGTQFNSTINSNSFAKNETFLKKLKSIDISKREPMLDLGEVKDDIKNIASFAFKSAIAKSIINKVDTAVKKVVEVSKDSKNLDQIIDTFENVFKPKMK
jgi:hypothetical protein